MGTAEIQGELWGARPKDWAELNEPAWRPLFRAALDRLGVGAGTKLLDVGCGAGGALEIARELGAEIAGLDASQILVEIARRRLPGARIERGEMEELPFADESFDAVCGINSFQFAGNLVNALREAKRVCREGGTVAMLVWGQRKDCDIIKSVMPPVFALLPPAPAPAAPPPQFAEEGVIESLMREAGLIPREAVELDGTLVFPDHRSAIGGVMAASARAIRHAGEEAVRNAAAASLKPFVRPDGTVVLNNRFRLVIATR